MRFLALVWIVVLFGGVVSAQAQESWARYEDPQFGYRIDLPVAGFTIVQPETSAPVLRLESADGALIEVYGGANEEGWTSAELGDFLAASDRVSAVTYRTGGRSWVVLSGYYSRQGFETAELIFYTKVMMSADRRNFAVFEMSYPASEKWRYSPIIERIEDSFRPPR